MPAWAARSADSEALQRLELSLQGSMPPTAARVLANRVEQVGDTTATLLWTTDLAVTAEIGCGLSLQALSTTVSLTAAMEHAQLLSGLMPGTLYWYKIVGRDDVTGTFVTAGRQPLRYESVGGSCLDAHQLQIVWTTNHPASMIIGLRHADDTTYTTQFDKPLALRSHTVMFGNLRAGNRYYFIIQSTDSTGAIINSGERSVVMPENNVALHRPVSGTFDQLPADPGVKPDSEPRAKVTDGDDAFATGTVNSGNINAAEQWVAVDLGDTVSVRSVVTVWRRLAYPQAFRLLGSSDGINWELIEWNINAADGVEARSRTGDPLYVVTTPVQGARYRYIKAMLTKGSRYFVKHAEWNFVQLVEMKVFGEE
ncbi:MAG TPA: discoidin domain-containing protein [bacterium]|nr:discoidin domain-containing protein [bacterium]